MGHYNDCTYKVQQKSSSQLTDLTSKWLVGLVQQDISGWPNSAWANNTLTFGYLLRLDIMAVCSSEEIPSPWRI